jgi:hypothetical protein
MDAQLMEIAGQAATAMVDRCIALGEARFNTAERLPRAQALLEPLLLRVAVLFLEAMSCNEPCAVTLRIGEDSPTDTHADGGGVAQQAAASGAPALGAVAGEATPKKGWLKSISSKLSNININLKGRGDDGARKLKAREGSVYRYNPGSHMWVKSKLHLHESDQGPVLDLFPVSKSSTMTSILCRNIDAVEALDTPCVYGTVFTVRYLSCQLMLASSIAADWIADLADGVAIARSLASQEESSTDGPEPTPALPFLRSPTTREAPAALRDSAISAAPPSSGPPASKENEYDVPARNRASAAGKDAGGSAQRREEKEESNYEVVDSFLQPSPAPGVAQRRAGAETPPIAASSTVEPTVSVSAAGPLGGKGRVPGLPPAAGPPLPARGSAPAEPSPVAGGDSSLRVLAAAVASIEPEEEEKQVGAVYSRVVKPSRRSDGAVTDMARAETARPAVSATAPSSQTASRTVSRTASRPTSPPLTAPTAPALPVRRLQPESSAGSERAAESSAASPAESSLVATPPTLAPRVLSGLLPAGPLSPAGVAHSGPDLPPRRSGVLLSPSGPALSPSSMSALASPSGPSPVGDDDAVELTLRPYPWYHSNISAADARDLVESRSSGAYLIRRSDSQKGQYVLCLNWCGTGTLLRIQTAPDGRCTLCGLKFSNIPALVSYFSCTPFPTTPEQRHQVVTLAEIVRPRAANDASHTEEDSNA